ncbi:hypothetical protein [Candidatus Igneacidithiobacillus taiwanensis]|uniref:hypothetical protein n=1 Tax=Candidatus Igneacidithiobacillus taiwanensis TaxID=1945924 RepID=UPI00289E80FE|nr:hypothetical protein [Candidatus Igneacidithiobacillus taiwanensis]
MSLSTVYDKRRRTRAQLEQLDAQILAALQADHPQSVRHLFYLMTDPRLPEPVEKSDRGYRHVQYRVTELRRAGRLDYSWISDATRRGYFVDTFRNAADFIRQMASLYRGHLWTDAGVYCEVWCESRSIASVIQADCEDLAVSLYPAGGFSSITLIHEAAQYINQETEGGVPAVIFYIGDLDPAGVLIDRSIEKDLRQHLRSDVHLEFRRLGITAEQVEQYDLPEKPRKLGDKRALHIKTTVEAEAMPAHILRQILRDAVEALLPPGALDTVRVAEESERQYLNFIAEQVEMGGEA